MRYGFWAGILWGLNTVLLGFAFQYTSSYEALLCIPFIISFFHDFTSALWVSGYMSAKKRLKETWNILKTPAGKFIIAGSILGGPLGMSAYIAAIYYIGPSYTSIVSSTFPAIGLLLARVFLRETMTARQTAFLFLSIAGVIFLGYTTPEAINARPEVLLGFLCASACAIAWAAEGVISAYSMKHPQVTNEHVLLIRQWTSAIFYSIILLPIIQGWDIAIELSASKAFLIVLFSACSGTLSYLFYYKAIAKIGPPKAMALNITYVAWAIVFSYILNDEALNASNMLLGFLIVGASYMASRPQPIKTVQLSYNDLPAKISSRQ